jgi:hypothetical protein
MNFLGGPLAFYELDPEEQKAAVTWYLSKADKNIMFASKSPICVADLAILASEIFGGKKKAEKNISGIDIFNI